MTQASWGGGTGLDPILEGALDAFSAHGYRGATMRGIARQVGVNVPQIYYRYPSKECLLSELMLTSTLRAQALVVAASQSSEQPLVRLARMVESLVRFGCREVKVLRLSPEVRSLAPDKREQCLSVRAAIEDLLTDAVTQAAERGLCRSTAPRIDVRAVVGMIQALASWYRPGGELDEDALVDHYVGIALRTVGAAPEVLDRHRSA